MPILEEYHKVEGKVLFLSDIPLYFNVYRGGKRLQTNEYKLIGNNLIFVKAFRSENIVIDGN